MLVVYYCAVDIFDYIVFSRCKVCSIFSGVKLLALGTIILVGTAVRTTDVL